MRLLQAVRNLGDSFQPSRFRQTYWEIRKFFEELSHLFHHENRAFRRHASIDFLRYISGRVDPINDQNSERMRAAVDWLLRAQAATEDDGVSMGYFPCNSGPSAWLSSYPETTGYIISSLLDYAERFNDDNVRQKALLMADWEIAVQMPSGAVQGGRIQPPGKQTPAAFNTGMVLDGWCTAYAVSQGDQYISAGRRAADFLIDDLDENGFFRTNGDFVSAGEVKTYNCLCAWALHRFGDLAREQKYRRAAIISVEAALRQQSSSGWFQNNCLTRSEAPLVHTIGYTLQGILEVGALSGRHDFIEAAQRGLDPVLRGFGHKGFLHGRFDQYWNPRAFSSCLTGSAQITVVSYRMGQLTGNVEYAAAADSLLNYLKALQALGPTDPNINGALGGSFPLFGFYMRAGYPNWATKYLLDALMLQNAFSFK